MRVAAKTDGVALAKVCRRLDVPLPPRDYWARKAAGQKVKPTPLPKRNEGVPEEIEGIRPKPSPLAPYVAV